MKQNRLTEILENAARLFRKRGYQATSLKDLASSIGIEAPSLYNHIRSKNEILNLLLVEVANRFLSGIREIDASSLTGIQKLEKAISHYVSISFDMPDAVSLITGEWVHLEDKDRADYITQRDAYEDIFRNIFRQAVSEGSIQAIDEDIAIYSVLSSLRWLYSWIGKERKKNPVELEKQLITALIDGLRVREQ